ncbi:MAG: hypothetical protein FJW40_16980 [Acidobacteria bacterium]|nr:hypothetical protein [Acidobacteriota bacterium]
MRLVWLCLVPFAGAASEPDALEAEILKVRRLYVDRLTGGEPAAQLRDMIIASLRSAKLFVVTENQDRADAILRGSAEDLVFTETHQTADAIGGRVAIRTGPQYSRSDRNNSLAASAGVNQSESSRIDERRHEAVAAVRITNKDGDVIWSTTQESKGAKFRGASADVADKITRQLAGDFDRLRKLPTPPAKSN